MTTLSKEGQAGADGVCPLTPEDDLVIGEWKKLGFVFSTERERLKRLDDARNHICKIFERFEDSFSGEWH